MKADRRPRVAVIAFTAQPGQGSEYEVGWRWTLLAAQFCRPVAIVRRACWDNIPGRDRMWRGVPLKRSNGATFAAIDLPGAPRLFRGIRLMRTHYMLWQLLTLLWLRRHRGWFDLAHHSTFVAPWMPPLTAFAGIPFVWGPTGTNPDVPAWYADRLPKTQRIRARLRSWLTLRSMRFNPVTRAALRRTDAVAAITPFVAGLFHGHAREVLINPSIGIDREWFRDQIPTEGDQLLFVGRGLHVKMPLLALDIAERVVAAQPDARALFVGRGLPALLGGKPVPPQIQIVEHLPQSQLATIYAQSTLLLFPSVESSGFVTLEALAAGLPVAVFPGTAPAAFAGNAGLAADGGTFDATSADLAAQIIAVLNDPLRRDALSQHARARARQFLWENYEHFLRRFYAEGLARRHK